MDDPAMPSSPRKKLKTDDTSAERTFSILEPKTSMMSGAEPKPQISQLSKEAEVGIVEFVSPDLPGFSGILKKRYIITGSPYLLKN